MTGGHLGVKRTMDQVQRRAFWHGWRSDVKRFCQQCHGCRGYFRGYMPRTAPPVAHVESRYRSFKVTLDAQPGAAEMSVELEVHDRDEHDRTHSDGNAIAGVPPTGVRSPRPRRRIRRPERYSD